MILYNKGRVKKTIHTLCGRVTYSRTILMPVDAESAARLKELFNTKSVVPVDDALGVSRLPFKMTYRLMSEVAKEAVSARSYSEAAEKIRKRFGIDISVSTVEGVADSRLNRPVKT